MTNSKIVEKWWTIIFDYQLNDDQPGAFEAFKRAVSESYELAKQEMIADIIKMPDIPENAENYSAGLYSRRNIEAFYEDLKRDKESKK